jgi:hypothetical protein
MTAETLLAALAQRGIKPVVYQRRGKDVIVWRDYKLLTPADRAALRELWQEVEALVLARNTAPPPSVAPPQAEPAPDPVLWTPDYSRRITWDDVIAADATKLPKPVAYERARAFVAKQQQDKRDSEIGPLVMRHHTGRQL